MTIKIISTLAAVEEADWEIPGLPEFTDSPEFTELVIRAFEVLNECELEGDALDYFKTSIEVFYNENL